MLSMIDAAEGQIVNADSDVLFGKDFYEWH
jgi:hypothetical protein